MQIHAKVTYNKYQPVHLGYNLQVIQDILAGGGGATCRYTYIYSESRKRISSLQNNKAGLVLAK